ncbi:hypothetical protein HMPREF0044_1470 [Gleimia coleocanis DSM 15436]|uniref:Flippase-like domain-containing protein n=1 Tax=Gleimia coleocanis DSM 15436 TaxID=525245 RepID=C0W217_9ACTO|nr:lysylphosphatidylglycerol synthase transmembrane domain-containing protein [Gleimia coleocanis]EEH63231.1 hypothetical protein HMPREF0044_1470 [Gleimia coleocanis DSM 15436]
MPFPFTNPPSWSQALSKSGTFVKSLNVARVKTAIMLVFAVGIGIYLYVSLDFEILQTALENANPLWLLAAFGFALLSYVGAAIPLVAFSNQKLHLWDVILTQVAASVVTLVAPAGIGPAALNLRFLTKQRISAVTAAATVTIVQVTQFISTVVLLAVIIFITDYSTGVSFPGKAVAISVVVIAIFAGVLGVFPRLRQWVWVRIEPTWTQSVTHFRWVLTSPKRLVLGVFGNILTTVSYVAAFGATLLAFNQRLTLTTLAVTYLVATSVGSAVPAPGGIGPVEGALVAGLRIAHISASIAISATLTFRLVTFYVRAPLGWFALNNLQKRDLV